MQVAIIVSQWIIMSTQWLSFSSCSNNDRNSKNYDNNKIKMIAIIHTCNNFIDDVVVLALRSCLKLGL